MGIKTFKQKKKIRQPGKKMMIVGTMGFVIIVYGTFVFFPILYGLWTSFYNWNPFQSQFDYVGLENYLYVMKDKRVDCILPQHWAVLGQIKAYKKARYYGIATNEVLEPKI